jgi:signal transduction histidine kinase
MQRDVAALASLIDDLFLVARLDNGRYELHPDPVDLTEVADEAIEALAPVAAAHRITLTLERDGRVRVSGNAAALGRVIRNLLDNAIRHAEGEVHVGLHQANGWAELTVDDDGPGVPVEAEQRIFDRFARLDESRDRSTGGVGLGLAVVRAVVEHHGGTVDCARSSLGGARFLVRLPTTA